MKIFFTENPYVKFIEVDRQYFIRYVQLSLQVMRFSKNLFNLFYNYVSYSTKILINVTGLYFSIALILVSTIFVTC